MSKHTFIAVDLGTETGRITSGTLESGILILHEIHRFQNRTLRLQGEHHWDLPLIFAEVVHGLMMFNDTAESLAVTAWGSDYGLLDAAGEVIGSPYSHRDARTVGKMEEVFKQIPSATIFRYTGVQSDPVTTLFQLFAHSKQRRDDFNRTIRLLFIPDLLNYYLTGKVQTEFTISTTSQMLHRETQTWCMPLVDLVWLPGDIPHGSVPLKAKREARNCMPKIFRPCAVVGPLKPAIAVKTGLGEIPVVAVGSHDKASAVAAIPADGSDWAFILSDSVSHIGIETTLPVLTIPAMEGNFTNEGGVEGTNLCMKKLSGLGLLEECRKQWYENSSVSAEMVSAMYIDAPAFVTFIDPDHYSFFNPPSMPDAIRGFCMNSGQDIPQTHAQIVRTILESLAMKYRIAIDQLRKVASREIHRIHITGTGCENEVFCQFIANACSVQVIAGPGETTTIGNILCQARTAGYLNSLEDIRSVVVHSFKTREYQPVKSNEWDKAHTRFLSFIR